MPLRIEDYALIGDCETAALVGKDGSIDWLCLPRFDSGACFAALLGTPEHGRWQLAPKGEVQKVSRRYREGTIILETTFETAEGVVTLIDAMSVRAEHPVVIRCVRGDRGQVPMQMHLIIRFDYGSIIPWVTRLEARSASDGLGDISDGLGGIRAVSGPDTLLLRTKVPLGGADHHTTAEFTVSEGEEVPFMLTWHPSHERSLPPEDPMRLLHKAERSWQKWSKGCDISGPWAEQILRSLLTLKALTYAPTGGVVAAATSSLPEKLGGIRNWDYRLCWIRDATFTLYALMAAGYKEEASAWREWLLRAAAGKPDKLQIMYGLAGEHRLMEWEVEWLPGYENSRPVRVGNGAYKQFQLDVYGELIDAMYQSRRIGLKANEAAWNLEKAIVGFLETGWKQPDEGIWEVRGPRRHFTHSKVMAWVAFDRAVKTVERFNVEGPVERWRGLRDEIHQEVCTKGFDREKNSFVQYYGSKEPDASLLMIPLVGFLPPKDPRVAGTVAAIERELLHDGFVKRYNTDESIDGLPPGEGVFLPCTFWLADNYVMLGRRQEAEQLFRRLLELCNDVGLISEEYDPNLRRLLGNIPQAFTHVGLINTAMNLTRHKNNPAEHRRD